MLSFWFVQSNVSEHLVAFAEWTWSMRIKKFHKLAHVVYSKRWKWNNFLLFSIVWLKFVCANKWWKKQNGTTRRRKKKSASNNLADIKAQRMRSHKQEIENKRRWWRRRSKKKQSEFYLASNSATFIENVMSFALSFALYGFGAFIGKAQLLWCVCLRAV